MWEKLEPIFEELEIEYSRQGSYADSDELPESFFTFWNVDTPENGFYDNESHAAIWNWIVYFYTKDASLLYTKIDEFITLAKDVGFVVSGRAKDISSGLPEYVGRCVNIKYIENYNS